MNLHHDLPMASPHHHRPAMLCENLRSLSNKKQTVLPQLATDCSSKRLQLQKTCLPGLNILNTQKLQVFGHSIEVVGSLEVAHRQTHAVPSKYAPHSPPWKKH